MRVFMGNHKVSVQDSGAPRGERNHWVVELNDTSIHEGFNGAAAQRLYAAVCEGLDRVKIYEPAVTAPPQPQPPVLLPNPPSHEEGYANNLTEALRKVAQVEAELRHVKEERDSYQRVGIEVQSQVDTLRDVLTLLAPDLKTMAILYQQQGGHARAQALMNICKSLGVV